MSWRVDGAIRGAARWIGYVDGVLTGDGATLAEIRVLLEAGMGVLETPTGPVYVTRGVGDERGAYLLALYLLDHAKVTGTPPAAPTRRATPEVEGTAF